MPYVLSSRTAMPVHTASPQFVSCARVASGYRVKIPCPTSRSSPKSLWLEHLGCSKRAVVWLGCEMVWNVGRRCRSIKLPLACLRACNELTARARWAPCGGCRDQPDSRFRPPGTWLPAFAWSTWVGDLRGPAGTCGELDASASPTAYPNNQRGPKLGVSPHRRAAQKQSTTSSCQMHPRPVPGGWDTRTNKHV
jgi:hypothetical protein